jgi:hypothetical protein
VGGSVAEAAGTGAAVLTDGASRPRIVTRVIVAAVARPLTRIRVADAAWRRRGREV